MNINQYSTIIFDCDGVILDSNKIKTQAFFQTALPFGIQAAECLVDYHKKYGGVSRYKKFEYFLKTIIEIDIEQVTLDSLLENFAREVREGLLKCEISSGLESLRRSTKDSCWMIVSGGDQNELRDIFSQRNIAHFFDGGIFGSPDTKKDILARELFIKKIKLPALFIGDSQYDHIASDSAGLDFIFVSDWTEMANWKTYCKVNNIDSICNLTNL